MEQRVATPAPARQAPGAGQDHHPNTPLVGVVWGCLIVNTLGSGGVGTIIPIPTRIEQIVTMGALGAAFTLAIILNPRLRIRPSPVLLLLSLLVVVSFVSSADLGSGYGALARCARLAVFIVTLWLITPWWDGTLRFVRYHVRALALLLASVALGLVLAPGLALPADFDDRLIGVLWWIPATQVGDYGAVVAGLTIVLWLARKSSGRALVGIAGPAIALLLLSHTRTATAALAVGVAVAGLSLALANARARRFLAVVMLGSGLIAGAFLSPLTDWFRRGQDGEEFANLTGRELVWNSLLAEPRTPREELIGRGLTDKSFDGLPIDSTWLAIYHEQGYLGIAIIVLILLGLIFTTAMRPPSPARACAVFLIVYGMIASYTQVGLGDASAYLLHLVVATALLAPGGQGPPKAVTPGLGEPNQGRSRRPGTDGAGP